MTLQVWLGVLVWGLGSDRGKTGAGLEVYIISSPGQVVVALVDIFSVLVLQEVLNKSLFLSSWEGINLALRRQSLQGKPHHYGRWTKSFLRGSAIPLDCSFSPMT